MRKKNWESPSIEKPFSEQVSSCLLPFSDMPTNGIYLGFGSNMIKLPVDQLESSVLRFDHLDPYLGVGSSQLILGKLHFSICAQQDTGGCFPPSATSRSPVSAVPPRNGCRSLLAEGAPMSPYVTWHLAWIQACDHTDVNLRISKLRSLH